MPYYKTPTNNRPLYDTLDRVVRYPSEPSRRATMQIGAMHGVAQTTVYGYLSKLRKMGLIRKVEKGHYVATDKGKSFIKNNSHPHPAKVKAPQPKWVSTVTSIKDSSTVTQTVAQAINDLEDLRHKIDKAIDALEDLH